MSFLGYTLFTHEIVGSQNIMTHKRKSLCLFCNLIRVQIGNCVILGKVGLSHTSMTANKLQTPLLL